MASYLTHTKLTLETAHEGADYVVKLKGDRVKELYRGPDQLEQQRIYRETKKHYEQRAKEEV